MSDVTLAPSRIAVLVPLLNPGRMTLCLLCNRPIAGPSIGDSAEQMHAGCFAERLPYDAAVALAGAAALFLVPFIRVWSA